MRKFVNPLHFHVVFLVLFFIFGSGYSLLMLQMHCHAAVIQGGGKQGPGTRPLSVSSWTRMKLNAATF